MRPAPGVALIETVKFKHRLRMNGGGAFFCERISAAELRFLVLPDCETYCNYIRYPQYDIGCNATRLTGKFAEHKGHELESRHHDADGETGRGVFTAGGDSQRYPDEREYKAGAGK